MLVRAHRKQAFERLLLAALPRFQNLLLDASRASLRGAGLTRIPHDCLHIDGKELEARLEPILRDASRRTATE